ncbi:unnamed protein product [Rhodiola kirilowii]
MSQKNIVKLLAFGSAHKNISADYYSAQAAYKQAPQGISNQIVHGVIAFLIGIVTMVRLTRNIPRKMADATLYSSSDYGIDMKSQMHQLPAPTTISSDEHMALLKRMAELEAKMCSFSAKPVIMPPEKEELLNAAISRIEALELELSATKKTLEDTVSRQGELLAYIEKKKKKKKLVSHQITSNFLALYPSGKYFISDLNILLLVSSSSGD